MTGLKYWWWWCSWWEARGGGAGGNRHILRWADYDHDVIKLILLTNSQTTRVFLHWFMNQAPSNWLYQARVKHVQVTWAETAKRYPSYINLTFTDITGFWETNDIIGFCLRMQRNDLVETWNSSWFVICRRAFGVGWYEKLLFRLSMKIKFKQVVYRPVHQNCSNAAYRFQLASIPIGQVCSHVWCRSYLAAPFGFFELRTFPWSVVYLRPKSASYPTLSVMTWPKLWHPIYDLTLNQCPVSELLRSPSWNCHILCSMVETDVKSIVKGYCWSVLSIMIKKSSFVNYSSKKHSPFKTTV